ncbi:hypothetical protein B0T17DRAFT_510508 [Bombardia bombarda]|uniref:MARVEL domain-containing protein n=1 Tax=Bombardia bombarda TaxID=252184 RepID=A0AA40BWA5_9PEZI|nr:hypothetical protein B0T17DRAFT_510508 [Bombardia bombarda]
MGARTGHALRGAQSIHRLIQLGCAAVVLALFSYFLATLRSHNMYTPTWIRAVEGISGAAVLYTLMALATLCCIVGHPLLSSLMMLLDLAFLGAFIYVAYANRYGASSCNHGNVTTPFGTGDANSSLATNTTSGGINPLPSQRSACRMQTASLAVSITAILFFLFSLLNEINLIRHRRKAKRFGPSPANDYTSGYGTKTSPQNPGFLSRFTNRKTTATTAPNNTAHNTNPNTLPAHTHPGEMRDSYASEQTRIGTANGADPLSVPGGLGSGYKKHESSPYGYGNGNGNGNVNTTTTGNAMGPNGRVVVATEDGHARPDALVPPAGAPPPPPPAHYPAGNYRAYDDGVYDRS